MVVERKLLLKHRATATSISYRNYAGVASLEEPNEALVACGVCVCASVGNMKYPRCIDLSSTSAVCATNEE